MTVDQLMSRVSSFELTQWRAFEKVNGPLGRQYSDDMLANIHEQLQAIQFILGRMSAGDESPVPQPHRMPRPHEVMRDHQSAEDAAKEAEAQAAAAHLAYVNRLQAEQEAAEARAAQIAEQNAAEVERLKTHLPGT